MIVIQAPIEIIVPRVIPPSLGGQSTSAPKQTLALLPCDTALTGAPILTSFILLSLPSSQEFRLVNSLLHLIDRAEIEGDDG